MNNKLYNDILNACFKQKNFFLPLTSIKGFYLPSPSTNLDKFFDLPMDNIMPVVETLNMKDPISSINTNIDNTISLLERTKLSPLLENKLSLLKGSKKLEVLSWLERRNLLTGYYGLDYKSKINYQDDLFKIHGIYNNNPNLIFFTTMPLNHNYIPKNLELLKAQSLSKHFVEENKGIPHGYLNYTVPCINCPNQFCLCFLCEKDVFAVGVLNHNKLPPYYNNGNLIRTEALPLCLTDVRNEKEPQGLSLFKENIKYNLPIFNESYIPKNYQHLPKIGLGNLARPWSAKQFEEMLPSTTDIIVNE